MELDLENEFADRAYAILASLVTPRPIALVTTISPEGHINAAPFSFFNVFGDDPPLVAIAPGDRSDGTPKDTAVNIHLTGEFVVNLVDETIADEMNQCAAPLPYGSSELDRACLHTEPSSTVKTPRIAESPVSMECREYQTLLIGRNRIVFGEVKRIHVRDEFFDVGKRQVRSENLFLIGRMAAPHWYCRTRDRFELVRPKS